MGSSSYKPGAESFPDREVIKVVEEGRVTWERFEYVTTRNHRKTFYPTKMLLHG